MTDITTTTESTVIDTAALDNLLSEFADASNELDRIYTECHAAYGILALKGEQDQTKFLKAQGERIALLRATALYPNDPAMAQKMATTDGRKPGATAVSHTALLQRAKAWQYALYMGDSPSHAVVAATFRLASASGKAKDAREAFEKNMKDAGAREVSEQDFAQAALDAAASVPPPAPREVTPATPAAPVWDVNTALDAIKWLTNNSGEVTGEDRKRVLAQARGLVNLYK